MPPRPYCHCEAYGCGQYPDGVACDPKTLKTHELADKTAAARKRLDLDRQVISAEQEEVGAFLSSVSLSGDISGHTIHGSRVWSQRSADTADTNTLYNFFCPPDEPDILESSQLPPSSSQSPLPPSFPRLSNRQREEEWIRELSFFRMQVDQLRETVREELRPGQAVDPNRVRTHLKSIKALRASIKTKIKGARLKQHSVIAMKEEIDTGLKDICAMLGDAETAPTPPMGAMSHDTSGFCCLRLIFWMNSDYKYR